MRRNTYMVLIVIALLFAAVAPAGAAAAERQTANVNWHAQQGVLGKAGLVDDASASVVRNDNGISFKLKTTGLKEGNAYTLWLVVINNPSICAPTGCTAADIFNPESRSQVRYGAGHVAGGSGKGTFAGHVSEGSLSGWLPDRGLEDARTAEIHLVVNDHGPVLSEFMPGMIKTYRGGCADRPTSPFPAIFPATAIADGEVGPNVCRLYQVAVLSP